VKLRRYHRWLALPFGLILLWVALTGIAMQALDIYDKGLFPAGDSPRLIAPARAHEHDEAAEAAEAARAARAAAAKAPGASTAAALAAPVPRPPRSKAQILHSFLQHLHSGEWFGPFGTIIQTLAGLAMTFFTLSGMWMYLEMFRARGRNRAARGEPNKLFW
jgi:uncharacterized iron-regulated membrane protein